MAHNFQHQEVEPTEQAYWDGVGDTFKNIEDILREFGTEFIFKLDHGRGNIEIIYNRPRNYYVAGKTLAEALLSLEERKERLGIEEMIK